MSKQLPTDLDSSAPPPDETKSPESAGGLEATAQRPPRSWQPLVLAFAGLVWIAYSVLTLGLLFAPTNPDPPGFEELNERAVTEKVTLEILGLRVSIPANTIRSSWDLVRLFGPGAILVILALLWRFSLVAASADDFVPKGRR